MGRSSSLLVFKMCRKRSKSWKNYHLDSSELFILYWSFIFRII